MAVTLNGKGAEPNPVLDSEKHVGSRPLRRVLFIERASFLGGVARIILTLAAGLREYGWEAVLACPGDGELPDAAREQGTAVAPCPFDRMRITADPRVLVRYPGAWLRGSQAIEAYCSKHPVDLIHAHHPVSALYALRATSRLQIPLVLHVHETLPARPLYAAAIRLALRRASYVLCVSGAARELAEAMGCEPARLRVVHNGIDELFLRPDPPAPAERVLEAGPGPHVGVFGVLEPRKAQHVLLEAAEGLTSRFPTARFWLVGPAALKDKQYYADRLKRMAEAPPLHGRVELVGFRRDVAAWQRAMDVVVQTSVTLESFGMALAEAQALGRPVIASRVGGMPEVVAEGESGLIVPPGDPVALGHALARLLGDESLRRRFGAHGALQTRRRFSPHVFSRNVAAAYDELAPAAQERPRGPDPAPIGTVRPGALP